MPKKKSNPLAYRNKVLRDIVRVLAPTAITTNLSPQRIVGFSKIVADLAAVAAQEAIIDHPGPATAPTPSAPGAAKIP